MSNLCTSKLPLSTPPLPQLPVELLRQIIELSPLLEQFDQLRISESGSAPTQNREHIKTTRVLSVAVVENRPLGSVESLVLSYPNLQELHIYLERLVYLYIDVSPFASLVCLTNLTISSIDARLPIPSTFPSLRYLTIYHSEENQIAPLLQPAVLPSLRVLALLYALPYYEEIDFDTLLSQLDLLIGTPCTFEHLEEDKISMEKHGDKFLMDVRYNEITGQVLPTIQHVRIRVTPGEMVEERRECSGQERINRWKNSEGHLNEAFNWFWDSRWASKIPYKSLFLDHGLYNVLESFGWLQDTYNHIVDEMCKTDGTEVVLEEQPVSKSADSAITPELLRWINRRKEKAKVEIEGELQSGTI